MRFPFPRPRLPIAVLLGGSIGAILVLSIAIVIGWMTTQGRDLLVVQVHAEANQRLARLAESVAHELDSVEGIARMAEATAAGPQDDLLRAVLSAQTGPMTLRIVNRIGTRDADGVVRLTDATDATDDAPSGWSLDPVQPILTYRGALTRVALPATRLSDALALVSDSEIQTAFLVADPDRLLALSNWATPATAPDAPQTLANTDDLDLRTLRAPTPEYRKLTNPNAHRDMGAQGPRVYLQTRIERPGLALTVGFHTPASIFGAAFFANRMLALVALGVLVASVCAGVAVSTMLGRPIERLATAARQIEALDLDPAPHLAASMMAELDEANNAFRSAFRALAAFARFVPRDVVRQAMSNSADAPLTADLREMTVLFTDLAGFTALTTHRPAAETASLLTDHFEMVTALIDREGGTVDKFMGDGVMAFWGAPQRQPDHAARALRAARAIATAFVASADPSLRLRIGLATGEMLVGTTGSRVRVNYTVLGDAVNIAARLQELGKDVAPDARIVALASGAAIAAAGGCAQWRSIGPNLLRGRDAPTEVFRLEQPLSPPGRVA